MIVTVRCINNKSNIHNRYRDIIEEGPHHTYVRVGMIYPAAPLVCCFDK